jgi:hypothetical protein
MIAIILCFYLYWRDRECAMNAFVIPHWCNDILGEVMTAPNK